MRDFKIQSLLGSMMENIANRPVEEEVSKVSLDITSLPEKLFPNIPSEITLNVNLNITVESNQKIDAIIFTR